MINRLVVENLKHRRLRTGLTALSIGFQVTMILTVVGLSEGMLKDAADRAANVGADILVKPPGASAIALSGASMPEKILRGFLEQPHVVKAAGALIVPTGGVSSVTGVNLQQFSDLSGDFRYLSGGPFKQPHDMLIDEWYSKQTGKKVGDVVRLLNTDWHVSGIVEAGKLARNFVPLDTLQNLTNNRGSISQVFLKLDDSKRTGAVVAALKAELPDYGIFSIQEFVSLFSVSNVPGLQTFIYVIIGLSVVIGLLVVSLTMYTTVLERTREIGIMKALGASPGDVMNILGRETLLLAVSGWLSGLVLSYLAYVALNRFAHASLQVVIVYRWWPIALAVSVVASLLGGLYPAMRAARQDAIEALAYE